MHPTGVFRHREKRYKDSRKSWEGRKYCCHKCAQLESKNKTRPSYTLGIIKAQSKEYVMPADFRSLAGYVSVPPPSLAAGVLTRYLRGAVCCY